MSLFKPSHKNNSGADSSRSANTSFVGVQAKLNIGKANDKYEKEADAVADKVVSKEGLFGNAPFISPSPSVQRSEETEQEIQKTEETEQIQEKPIRETITPLIQRMESEESDVQLQEEEEVQRMEEEEAVQMMEEESEIQQKSEMTSESSDHEVQAKNEKPNPVDTPSIQRKDDEIQEKEEELQEKEEETEVQQKSTSDTGNTSNLENNLRSSKGGGSPMDADTKTQMESGFGTDFSGVRIHNDSNAVQMNQQLGSQAFANGNDIYFNKGKYNPSSKDGQHLLAHELTHTIQQGASTEPAVQKAAEGTTPEEAPVLKPTTPLDISHRLDITDAWAKYLDAENAKKARPIEVDVKIGERYSGTIELSRKKGTDEGELAKYEITSGTTKRYLKVNGWNFLDPMRAQGIEPVLVLNNFGDEQVTTGFLSVAINGASPQGKAKGFLNGLNDTLDKLGFLGLSPIKIAEGFENEFSAGRLVFQIGALKTVVDGYLEAGGGLGITGDVFTFNVNATVDIPGIASGELMIARGEDGSFSGSMDIEADIANVNAKLHAEYINGAVTIQGTGKIQSEKFTGEITLLVTDKARSNAMMDAALGVESMDGEKKKAEAPAEPLPKTKKNQVLAGWGTVETHITPWLAGTASIGVDSDGHVTIVGEINVPDEVELMEKRGKKVSLFDVEIRAGYGIPLVGQVFLFASIGMFMNAGFGPLVLKNVGLKGTYSTDTSKLREFEITGTLGINAFAILGLEAEAGVGLTLLGHDLKAGVNVTAAAGLRAYAEATPTLEYKEQATPEGGKVGESRLKGHFEAAAQLFLQLSGSLFYELDSPWWSPAPDGREDFPFMDVQYPIGDSMGIGADMDWLIGSGEAPELKFSPVEFDPDKFTADIFADPPPNKKGKSDEEKKGEWVDGNQPGDQKENPEMKDGKGLPENSKKKEDLKKLPDQEKYMRALDEMAKLEKASPKPTLTVVQAKAKKVKKKYGIDSIAVTDKKDQAEINVKHKKENNKKNILKVPLMSAQERAKLLAAAMTDLKAREKKAGGEEGKIDKSGAEELITEWKKANEVINEVHIVDGKRTWDYFIDIVDKSNTEQGLIKSDVVVEPVLDKFDLNGEGHTLRLTVGDSVSLEMASGKFTELSTKISSFINEIKTGQSQPYVDKEKIQLLLQDLEVLQAYVAKQELHFASRTVELSSIERELSVISDKIRVLFKNHFASKKVKDFVLDALFGRLSDKLQNLTDRLEVIINVFNEIEKHTKNKRATGDGLSTSAVAAENFLGWLAVHIDDINLIEVRDLVRGKKVFKNMYAKIDGSDAIDRFVRDNLGNYAIPPKGTSSRSIRVHENAVDSTVSAEKVLEKARFNDEMNLILDDLRNETLSDAVKSQRVEDIVMLVQNFSYQSNADYSYKGVISDDVIGDLRRWLVAFVNTSTVRNDLGVFNIKKPPAHEDKVVKNERILTGILTEMREVITGYRLDGFVDEEYETMLVAAIDEMNFMQEYQRKGKPTKEYSVKDVFSRGLGLAEDMADLQDAIQNSTLDSYLRAKGVYNDFAMEVYQTKTHVDFADLNEKLRQIYGVSYGDPLSVTQFNQDNVRQPK